MEVILHGPEQRKKEINTMLKDLKKTESICLSALDGR